VSGPCVLLVQSIAVTVVHFTVSPLYSFYLPCKTPLCYEGPRSSRWLEESTDTQLEDYGRRNAQDQPECDPLVARSRLEQRLVDCALQPLAPMVRLLTWRVSSTTFVPVGSKAACGRRNTSPFISTHSILRASSGR